MMKTGQIGRTRPPGTVVPSLACFHQERNLWVEQEKEILRQPGGPESVSFHIWMFPKIGGKPPKWMVKIMEKPY